MNQRGDFLPPIMKANILLLQPAQLDLEASPIQGRGSEIELMRKMNEIDVDTLPQNGQQAKNDESPNSLDI